MKFSRSNFDRQIDKLPKEVIWCKKCTISNQRPRININSNGICNACENISYKKKINWKDRKKELKQLLKKYKKKEWRI